MSLALIPGSFDPLTLGHVDLAARAAKLFDRVTLLVMKSHFKTPRFTPERRMLIAAEALKHLPNVTVDTYDGLTTDYACAAGADVIVKGLRSAADYDYECEIAEVLRRQSGIETLFLRCRPELAHVSTSTGVHLFSLGADVSEYFPPAALAALKQINHTHI